MQTGIIGLPQVGKTTLFKILTRAQLDEKASRAATHVGVARVPEPRLEQLAKLYNPKKITYATVEYVDVGGMVKDRTKIPLYSRRCAKWTHWHTCCACSMIRPWRTLQDRSIPC